MQVKTKAGLALVLLGFVIFAGWNWWQSTRNFVPLNLPLKLALGQKLISEFKINFDGSYLIEIEAEKGLPPEALRCFLGLPADPAPCQDLSAPMVLTWIISSEGQELSRGSSRDVHSAAVRSDTATKVIGQFQARAGQKYSLQVNSLAPEEADRVGYMHLKVAVASIAYSDLQSAGVLVFSMAFICELFGMLFLILAFYSARKKSSGKLNHRE
jgi:hypothetical protein